MALDAVFILQGGGQKVFNTPEQDISDDILTFRKWDPSPVFVVLVMFSQTK